MNFHNGHALQAIVKRPAKGETSVYRKLANGVGVDRIEQCLQAVQLSLEAGNEEEAIAAIRRAFVKDDETITLDSPLAAIAIDQRTLNALDSRDVFTVRDLQARPFEWLRTIPNFAGKTEQKIAAAMIDHGFTMDGLDGWMVAQAMQQGGVLSIQSADVEVLTLGDVGYPAYLDHAGQTTLDEHTRRRLWVAINTPHSESELSRQEAGVPARHGEFLDRDRLPEHRRRKLTRE